MLLNKANMRSEVSIEKPIKQKIQVFDKEEKTERQEKQKEKNDYELFHNKSEK